MFDDDNYEPQMELTELVILISLLALFVVGLIYTM